MKRTWTALHVVGLIVGGYIVFTEVASNVEHIVHGTGSLYNPAVFTAIGVSIGTVFAFTMAMDALEDWKRLSSWVNAMGLFAAFVFGTAFTLSTTLDRTSTARDNHLTQIWKNDEESKSLLEVFQKVSYQAARECGSGRGKKCEAISDEVKVAQMRLDQRRSSLDSMGKRISAATGGMITPEKASIFQPMFMPIAMFFMGIFMVAYGVKGRIVTGEFQHALETPLTGMAAKEDKAKRFIKEYMNTHGNAPSINQVKSIAEVSYPTAKRYLDRYKT